MATDPVAGLDRAAVRACLEEFRSGELSEAKLRNTLEQLTQDGSRRQDLFPK